MKVIIPVAGAGKHLRPHTYSQPKPLIPIAGKSLLSHIIDNLTQAGFREFVFVLGYLSEKVRQYLLRVYQDQFSMHFVYQEERLGLAHAIGLCRPLIENDPEVLIVLGDTLARLDWAAFTEKSVSRIAIARVSDPSQYGIAEVDIEGRFIHVTEKPAIPRSNLAMIGVYYFREPRRLLEAIDQLLANRILSHGEYQLTDALQLRIEAGDVFYAYQVDNWLNCEKKEALLAANRLLLAQNSLMELETYAYTIIIPPAYIPPSAKLYRVILGPYVTLGDHVEIQNAIIQDSIIGAQARLHHVILRSSIIGGEVIIRGRESVLNLGDNTDIEL